MTVKKAITEAIEAVISCGHLDPDVAHNLTAAHQALKHATLAKPGSPGPRALDIEIEDEDYQD